MSFKALTPYDIVYYPGHSFPETHPIRLATMGNFYGMESAPVNCCRLLELGCGVGDNLIPMAQLYPQSSFVGIDSSAHAIESGQTNVTMLGLRNIDLVHRDIMDFGQDDQTFDYIIAHGVYSWVPPAVREQMMRIYGKYLAPNGVAYVSYNAHPGSHLRDMVRDMMLFHVRDVKDPKMRIEQARSIAKFIAEASIKESVYGAVLREEFERIEKMADEVLFHDDLEENSTAFLLHQVVATAERHGLQYLCDSSFRRHDLSAYPEEARRVLGTFPVGEFMARDQYQDFIDGHGFRNTLLCRADVRLDRTVDPEKIRRFSLAAPLRAVAGQSNVADDGVAEFKTDKGHTLATDHLLSKAALLELSHAWPEAVGFPDLLEHARRHLRADGAQADRFDSDEHVQALIHVLFQAVSRGLIELQLYLPPLTARVGDHPEVFRVARMQSQNGILVTNVRHATVMIEDEIVRKFLQLVDGTRTVDQLLVELQHWLNANNTNLNSAQVDRGNVEHNLQVLAKLALLIQP